jgi:hypothetical protein
MNSRENILERLRASKPGLQEEFPLDVVSSRAVKPNLLKQIQAELIDV